MSEIIIWNNRYSIGVTEIDNQHKKLFEFLNSYHKSLVAPKDGTTVSDAVKSTVDNLIKYTTYHFREEEKLMNSIQGVDFSSHIEQHKDFCSKITTLNTKVLSGKNVSFELFDFIKTWLINHILISDKSIGNALAQKGN